MVKYPDIANKFSTHMQNQAHLLASLRRQADQKNKETRFAFPEGKSSARKA